MRACNRCGALMEMRGACSNCGWRTRDGTGANGWSDRNKASHMRFARAVKDRDGWRCTFIDNGTRCSATTRLIAHHLKPGNDDPSTGVTVCPTHHKVVDRHAR